MRIRELAPTAAPDPSNGRIAATTTIAAALVGVLLPLAFPRGVGAVEPLDLGGFTFEVETTVPGDPVEIFDAFTGDVSGWWDHHHSESPKELRIEARPGGGFWEIFDDEGNGAKLADVIYSHRGELLILRGPLGLVGNATDFVYRLAFEASEGDSARVHLTARAAGQIEEGWGPTVERVWNHFLVEQFREWVVAGKHREE